LLLHGSALLEVMHAVCAASHLRLLGALAHGIPVLTPKWLKDCKKAEKLIVPGDEASKAQYVAHARVPELEAQPLFTGMLRSICFCVIMFWIPLDDRHSHGRLVLMLIRTAWHATLPGV
jgi:hypothetical protein